MATPALDRLDRDPAFHELTARGRRRTFGKGQVIISEGELGSSLFYILAGSVSIRRTDAQGDEALLAYRYAGDFFGEMCLFPGMAVRTAMVQSRDECEVLEVQYRDFLDLTRTHTRLWLELAGQLAERLRATNQRLAMMPLRQAADRIWSVVAEIALHGSPTPGTDQIPVRVTRQELGKLAACSREVAGEALKDLERTGQLTFRGQTLLVSARALTERIPAWPSVG